MRNTTNLLLLVIALSISLNGCGTSPSVAPTPTTTSATPIPNGKTILITSAEDNGPDTLRQGLLDANIGDTVNFDTSVFPLEQPTVIYLQSALEIAQGGLTIDARQAGVILDGSRIPDDVEDPVRVISSGNTISGFQMRRFTGAAISIIDGQHNLIQDNVLGGSTAGILLWGETTSDNTIKGNYIGVLADGATPLSNRDSGIILGGGAHDNQIGPDNHIAFNGQFGIYILDTNTIATTILQNSIHDNEARGIIWSDDNSSILSSASITSMDLKNGTVAGLACPDCRVELFSDKQDQGEVYEGYTIADANGLFDFKKHTPLVGPNISALVIDGQGNSSEFLSSTALLQVGNMFPVLPIDLIASGDLEDNRIGANFADLYHPEEYTEVFPNGRLETNTILRMGYKRIRLSIINDIDYDRIDWTTPELSIDPQHDQFITDLTRNGVKVTLILTFWDKTFVEEGGILGAPRFQNEGEIQRYLDFVQFTVSHFRDRVEYYEIWNEPDNIDTIQGIKVEDYIDLVRRTVPIIRHEAPEAKIVVGGTSFLLFPDVQEYLFTILKSDVMALVDGVAWHPFYGTSPQYDFHLQYYYAYPILVQRIKDTASANGFSGEYFADELTWRTEDTAFAPWPHVYSEELVAKYLARGIIMHLGMDIAITQNGHWPERYGNVIQGLCTSMAGAKPILLPVTIQSQATNTRSYGFSFPNGEDLLAVWSDSVAVDVDSGIPSSLKIPGYAYWNATSIDMLNSTEQELITSNENGDLIIRDFLLKDYPVLILLSK